MNIVLDGRRCDAKANSVGDAIAAAAALAEQNGRRIVEVIVDGDRMTQSDLDSPSQMNAAAGEVQFVSVEPRAMVRETFLQAADSLEELDRLQRTAAELMQGDRLADAMTQLDEAISIWMMVQNAALTGVRFAGIDLDAVDLGDRSMQASIDELNRHLQRMIDALRNQDVVDLSDTLLYEMPDVVESWRTMLRALAEEAVAAND